MTYLGILLAIQMIISIFLLLVHVLYDLQAQDVKQFKLSLRQAPSESIPLPTLEQDASWFERITFSWVTPLITRGNLHPLERKDVWELKSKDKALASYSQFSKYAHRFGLGKSLFFTLRHLVIIQMTMGFLSSILVFSGPYYLNKIVSAIERDQLDPDSFLPWVYITGLFVTTLLKSFTDGQSFFLGRRASVRARSALITFIYTKALKRRASKDSSTLGEIQTLFSVDVNKVSEYVAYCHNLIITPITLGVSLYSLHLVLGWSAFCGVAVIIGVYLKLACY
jgi:hypothetical protein